MKKIFTLLFLFVFVCFSGYSDPVDSNTASGPDVLHGGGGIFNNGGTLVVNNSTISNNISDGALGNGGGVHVKTGNATLRPGCIQYA